MCGEQGVNAFLKALRGGSPPHVRGTDQEAANAIEKQRITPACAGNRNSSVALIICPQDHPRMCGEQ